MIFLSVLPLLKDSAMTLLLQTPSNIQYEILDRILKLENVLSYSDEHFWNLSSSTIVGTIHIQIRNEGDEQRITSQVRFNEYFLMISSLLFGFLSGTNDFERGSDSECCRSSRKTSLFQSFNWTKFSARTISNVSENVYIQIMIFFQLIFRYDSANISFFHCYWYTQNKPFAIPRKSNES